MPRKSDVVGHSRESDTVATCDEWSVVPSPSYDTRWNQLNAVAVVSANDAWAVRKYPNPSNIDKTLVEHWDGNIWSIVPSPNQGVQGNYLSGVAAAGPDDVWAVGEYSDSVNTHQTLAEHWNGSTWSVVASPTDERGYYEAA